MTRYFAQNTPRAGLEHMMMSVPGFQKRGGGMMILSRFCYKPEDVDCRYCLHYRRRSCQVRTCPYIAERLKSGAIEYLDLILEYFGHIPHAGLHKRIQAVEHWSGPDQAVLHTVSVHLRSRFADRVWDDAPPGYLAALYLLASKERLWQPALPALSHDSIDFSRIVSKPHGFAIQDYSIEFRGPEKIYLPIPGLPKKGVHQLFACAVRYPRLHVRMENYARLAMQEDEWYNNLSDESCAMPGTFAVFALGLEGPKWWRLVCDYLDRCDDEHSSLQEKFIHTFFKKYGFTAQSLPVLVHGVQSMQNLKPAKEFRTLIANEESLDALMEIKGHLEYYLPEESGNDKRALAYLWRDVLWAIWGTASENGGSKVIKTAPKELKEKYQQVFA